VRNPSTPLFAVKFKKKTSRKGFFVDVESVALAPTVAPAGYERGARDVKKTLARKRDAAAFPIPAAKMQGRRRVAKEPTDRPS